MALGAHELLLIVRAQNQASAALGRVRRDLLSLENMRNLQQRRAQQQVRQAQLQMQQSRLEARQAAMMPGGSQALRFERERQSIIDQRANIQGRMTNLAQREGAIDLQRSRIANRRLRFEDAIKGSKEAQFAASVRVRDIENQQLGLESKRAALGVRQAQLDSVRLNMQDQRFAAHTRVLQRQLSLERFTSRLPENTDITDKTFRQTVMGKQLTISERQLASARKAEAALAGQGRASKLLSSQEAQLATQTAALNGEFAQHADKVRVAENQVRKLQRAEQQTVRDRAVLSQQLQQLDLREGAVTARRAEMQRQLDGLILREEQLTAQILEQQAALGENTAALRINESQQAMLANQMRETAAAIDAQKWERMNAGARATSHVGRVMQMTGMITTAAFGAMALAAAHFNQEATRAATQTGSINSGANVVVRNAERIQREIPRLMMTIPANQQDMTDALYNIYSSMNTTFGGGIRLLRLFGQMWVAGGMTGNINDVADALITLGNNWKISANNMQAWGKLAASTLATVRFGRLTVEQYTQTMNQLAPAFRGANQSIGTMNASLAFLTRQLPSTHMSAAGLARLMEILGRFAAKPAKGFEDLAKSIQDTHGNLLPLDKIIAAFIKRMPDIATSGIALTNVFKTVANQQSTAQARRAMQALVRGFAEYRMILGKTSGDQNEFKRSLSAMEQSTGVRWATFVNQMRALALIIGAGVLPALLSITRPLQQVAQYMNGLSENTKRSIGYVGAFIAVGTLLGGTILTIVGGLAAMVFSMRVLGMTTGRGAIPGMIGLGRAAEGASGELATAKVAVADLGEAGFATAGILTRVFAPALGIVMIPVLMHYHGAILRATTGTNGFAGALNLLKIALVSLGGLAIFRVLSPRLLAMGAASTGAAEGAVGLAGATAVLGRALLTLRMAVAIGGIRSLIATLVLGTARLVTFRGLLLGLGKMSALQAVGIGLAGYALSRLIRQIPYWDRTAKALGGTIHRLFETPVDPAPTQNAAQKRIEAIKMQYEGLRTIGKTPIQIRAQILEWNRDYKNQHDLDVWINYARRYLARTGGLRVPVTVAMDRNEAGRLAQNAEVAARQAKVGRFDTQQASIFQQVPGYIAQLNRLRRAADGSTDVRKIRAYLQYQKTLQDTLKNTPQLYQAITQAADELYGKQATMSDAAYMKQARNLDNWRKRLEASQNGSITTWARYYAAVAKLDKNATDTQRQAAQQILSQGQSTIGGQAYLQQRTALERTHQQLLTSHSRNMGAWQRYYKDLATLNARSSAQQQQAADDIIANVTAAHKKALKETTNNARQALQQVAGSLTSTFANYQQTNQQQFGSIFQGPWLTGARMGSFRMAGFGNNRQDILHDLRAQVSRYRQWRTVLNRLSARGIPYDLLQMIQNAGPEALDDARLLLQMNDRDFTSYTQVFQRGQRLVAQSSQRDMQREMAHWKKLGNNIMLAVMRGMDEHSAQFANYFRNLAISMFPELARRAHAKPRSASSPIDITGMPRNTDHSRGHTTIKNETNHYNVHTKEVDVSTAMRKLKHLHKNR